MLSDEELRRYERNIAVADIGREGQELLKRASVLVIGAGGLGSAVLQYLAAAGIGRIGIADRDLVDLSNLQRQVIHAAADLERPKVESAKDKIQALNSNVVVTTHMEKVTRENARSLVSEYDFITDCTDNFEAKFLINDACVRERKPFSHCGVVHFIGQALTYVPGSACYRCVFSAPPVEGSVPTSREAGIIGAVAGLFGTIQALEAIKYLVGSGTLLKNRMLIVDTRECDFRTVRIAKDPGCSACGRAPD
ncbi:MAG: adenylyltransferase [Candidatus Raymondbacteria bacterium RifOxyA12_full_50_37]|uniref:Adenylyltransferase n=1 Tax=Candidatus Raymondbacteria bacterium RIFOXYD12_FULL_49_13 TaxID=1817890 RepID=A0A1F7F3I8_UNCRA|nr:MAG: adenylyltransferase [Candidatus Raymondbacteria bacterium RifOxyA12_full_50_37]OGJ85989.1 MAG: adenylyltransferase [Candidatus Raymondbacteria bacterium RIFOXYA2_FULL_49_16]OGJ90094.1 MAG: adenylyltransferase [Candidatus Raymondbacteria bacterium RifOxyB12_full_50_8]OGJ97129.1 MAG: adenylyltransferase [Candidatus Raymondbacteria bacterium RIFOXYC2_FULL_50_21]OGK01168.1 MAG: adenylyltransferase [Candidatus Raymondbacteria bacterium RIFOXYD12_FULL_49_13]OGP40196.1 MAG: adenylyltransferas